MVAFGGWESPEYSSVEEAQSVLESLMIIYNQINDRVFRRQPRLPKECKLLSRTMANFQDGAALHRWSRGFAKASAWLQDVWQDALSDEGYGEYLTIHAVLGAPGHP
ncbi:MAG: YecA family protein [Gammaproteobacteria bacterium]|nr:YecA family protein [Gammaproteobacteria bacterium]